jgi:MFS family permease
MSKRGLLYGISFTIILLGLASFFTDLSSELIIPILPLFIVSLGGTGLIVGLIGGLSDAAISVFKVFSGYWSDRMGKRKSLIIFGYSFSAAAKFLMALASSWWHILILRPLERIGKGIREPPRDALAAEITKKKIYGKIFGALRVMDILGAVVGSTLVFFMLYSWKMGFSTIFLIAGLISALSVISLLFVNDQKRKKLKINLMMGLKKLPKNFRTYLVIATVFAIADFSYMFFILRAKDFFVSYAIPVALYIVFNLFYSGFALPLGILSDKIGRKKVLIYGYLMFVLSCLSFIFADSLGSFIFSFALYGLAYAFIVGNEIAFAADMAPKKEIGTALGTFHTSIAAATLPASIIAGLLWQYVSHIAPFIFGALIAVLAIVLFITRRNLDGK